MKTKLITLSLIALLAITSISCSKDDPAPAAVTPPAASATDGFTWTINGTAATKNITKANYNLQGTAMNLFAIPTITACVTS